MPEFMHKLALLVVALLAVFYVHAANELSAHELTLAREIGFDPEILKMVKSTGHRIEVLRGVSRSGNSHIVDGLSFKSLEQHSHALVKRLAADMEARGYRIYIQELGYGYQSDSIAIIKSTNKFDILRTRKTHAYTADLDTEQIIDQLRDWDKRYGVRFIGAGYNWVKLELGRRPDDVARFSREILEFCPDVLSSMSGTMAQLMRDIQAQHSIFLQWK